MLEKLLRWILKRSIIRREIEAYKREKLSQRAKVKKQEHHHDWQLIMQGMRDTEMDKVVDYVDTRMMAQRQVVPLYVDSCQWGIER
ncbi:conserved hypothetical protein [Candidatus Desulfosporosinus infrequens]|uniref:Uncharacterized protein n=1 Tax=Candidatus Desulfosporosinus infrequens TaxID=2043169 RepID=A0A2U3LGW1_9FIRM|nr:conserved hypothetical protein [Candidatus Desulfosporosinus infrequens]